MFYILFAAKKNQVFAPWRQHNFDFILFDLTRASIYYI